MERNETQKKNFQTEIVTSSIENFGQTTNYYIILKVITVSLCLVGFLCNTFIIFKHFIDGETVTSTKTLSTSKHNSELLLPSFTLCGCSGYRKIVDNYSDLNLINYLNNTIELKDLQVEVVEYNNGVFKSQALLDTTFINSTRWRVSTTYSTYRGRCYTIEYKKKVYKL